MQMASIDNDNVYHIAKKNYDHLKNYCMKLEQEGYWENPYQILKKPIYEVLDLYIQSVLVLLSLFCGSFTDKEKQFILFISEKNVLGINIESEEQILANARKIVYSPPILLQLCGVMDRERKTNVACGFFDSILNLLLVLTYADKGKKLLATKFIQEYYQRIHVFLSKDIIENEISPRYIFRKLSCEKIEESVELLLEEKKRREELESLGIKGKIKINAPKILEIQKKSKEEDLEQETILEEETIIEEKLIEKQEDCIIEKKPKIEEELKIEKELEDLLEELNSLIGLKSVKEEINSLINLIKVRKMREEYKMPTMEMTYHMVFTGSPGTGKTTVARLVAKIYKELGILSKGTFVETDRSGLVAGYVGQTAMKVKEIVEKSIGGVLFIDEAYSLTNTNVQNDFGSEAIETLVKMMEDHRDNLVIIVAGYTKEMQEFLKSNTGLVSRFNKFIEFKDYSVRELMCILDSMAKKAGFSFEEDAKEDIRYRIVQLSRTKRKNFGNARGIRNIFEQIVVNQANRLVSYNNPTKEQLTQILKEDTQKVNLLP